MSSQDKSVFRVIPETLNQSSEQSELEKLRSENERLKAKIRGLEGHTEHHYLYRKILREVQVAKPIKGIWLP